jgi:CheY-like chemotaxis protein
MSKILVVDDEVQIRTLLSRMLELRYQETMKNCIIPQTKKSSSLL